MSETHLVIIGLRRWADKMTLATTSDEALTAALREFVCNQEVELARLCTRELMRRRNEGKPYG
jgi:hypothetical protein